MLNGSVPTVYRVFSRNGSGKIFFLAVKPSDIDINNILSYWNVALIYTALRELRLADKLCQHEIKVTQAFEHLYGYTSEELLQILYKACVTHFCCHCHPEVWEKISKAYYSLPWFFFSGFSCEQLETQRVARIISSFEIHLKVITSWERVVFAQLQRNFKRVQNSIPFRKNLHSEWYPVLETGQIFNTPCRLLIIWNCCTFKISYLVLGIITKMNTPF